MRIRYLSVRNFRGISQLDWPIDRDINCLIGAGDSTKSTILCAIYYVFYPTWGLQINDADFYNQNVENPIEITATFTDIPTTLQVKYGHYLRGIRDNQVVDEPGENDEPALTLKLIIASDLEPQWIIFTERHEEDELPRFSQKDRQSLCVFKLGGFYDADFSWTKYSTLSRLSDQKESVRQAIRNVKAAPDTIPQELNTVAQSVQAAAVNMGVRAVSNFQAAVDTVALQDGKGAILLQDGDAPLRMKGNGTKRLIALGIQRKLTTQGSVITIDEIEAGLEPYRLRHLIREIREAHAANEISQMFATTHSAVGLVEFKISELVTVLCDSSSGIVTVKNLPDDDDLQRLIRSHDEALLGRKIIVGEGDTEYGFCVGLDQYWCSHDEEFFTYFGAVPTVSNGRSGSDGIDNAVANALKMHDLGYEVAILIDGDRNPGKITITELEKKGITVFRWPDGECIETIIFKEIDEPGFKRLLIEACRLSNEQRVLNELHQALPSTANIKTLVDINSITINQQVREKVGAIAREKAWFKTRDGGKMLGYFVAKSLPSLAGTVLNTRITAMKKWAKG